MICNQDNLQISIRYPKAKTPPPVPEAGPCHSCICLPFVNGQSNYKELPAYSQIWM